MAQTFWRWECGNWKPKTNIDYKICSRYKNSQCIKTWKRNYQTYKHCAAYIFARDVKGAIVGSLEDLVVRSKSSYICLLFAKNVEVSDKKHLLEVVKNSDKKVKKQDDEEMSL